MWRNSLTREGEGSWYNSPTTFRGYGYSDPPADSPVPVDYIWSVPKIKVLACILVTKIYTSYNVRGEPVVNTPEDAFNCFMRTELDILAIGKCYLDKKSQDKSLKKDYKIKYELD